MINLKKFKYYLMPTKAYRGFKGIELNNSLYQYWKEFWGKIYSEAGALEAFVTDDFLRQEFVGVLTFNDQIVGCLFSSFFNLNQTSTLEHRYFKFYPLEYVQSLKARNIEIAQSVEFLTLDPAWRKSRTGISLSEVIIGLSLKAGHALNADAIIGTARSDVGVNDSCYKYGFECLIPNVSRRNFNVDLIAYFTSSQTVKHPDQSIDSFIDYLWENKIDLLGLPEFYGEKINTKTA